MNKFTTILSNDNSPICFGFEICKRPNYIDLAVSNKCVAVCPSGTPLIDKVNFKCIKGNNCPKSTYKYINPID